MAMMMVVSVDFQTELEPMERQRSQLVTAAERRTNALTWVGLGLMGVQFGALARLTWWEYSWDIMVGRNPKKMFTLLLETALASGNGKVAKTSHE